MRRRELAPPPPPDPLPPELRTCKTTRCLRPILARLYVAGLVRRAITLCKLVEFLALSRHPGFLLHAQILVDLHQPTDLSPSSSTFLYNTLFRGFALSSSPHESLLAFSAMLRRALKPDRFTFPFLVKSSSVCRSVVSGTQVHNQVIKFGFDSDVYVVNTLLSFYSVIGEIGSARRLFDASITLDVVSYNTLIDGYVKSGEVDAARIMFDEMPEKNEVSWTAMISGHVRNGELDAAQYLFDRMPVGKNVVTCNSMILGFARNGLLSLARKLFDEMPERSVVSWNSMISGYAQCGELDMARSLFYVMPERDVFSWSCLISGYAQYNRLRESLELFKEMLMENKTRPNEVTLLSVLSVCSQLAALEQGKWVHAYIDRNEIRLTENLGAALVDMYAKCGSIENSMEIFSKLDEKNVSAWNALITGLAVNGLSSKSLEMFKEMQGMGVMPNGITFVGVLMACCHGGLVEEGRGILQSMYTIYGIKPELKHYGCVVDLLGRAGLLKEAEEIIRSMPMEPDVMILGALLGACKIHGNIKVADRVSDKLLRRTATEAGCHVLLSNIYSSAGRWYEALEIRGNIKRIGIKKEPGASSVELNGTVYEFVAGDKSHPQAGEVYMWLDEMSRKLRSEGYIPLTTDALHDLDEEDKEISLIHHSEKLAIAFAMIKNAEGSAAIRIVKNLRICGDCHLFIKHVSKLCKQKILVRDRTRFHHFVDGLCSCKDYW